MTECDGTTDCKINHNPDSIKAKIGNNDYNVLKNDEITVSDLELKILNYDNSILSNVSVDNLGALNFTISDSLSQPTFISYSSSSVKCNFYQQKTALKVLTDRRVDVVVPNINVTNIITPNNDDLNDVLRFNSQQIIKESELWIYNRWGSRIYHTKDYKNDWSGERFPGGTYYYVLKINDATYKSALTLNK
ncbi:MAG: gliding motility-associated C-terminal domain-containing protein [Saprospiraceae bacterium]|uniref:T9SS type B sorting domain-containing protein n=1 Tax=Candidatus Brachybacter algidus TaxID=2982024 RepID=UPI0025795F94|nr:gliding motility-associated C-terminal domain-containing protein [Candidatus Brachybacter algidus]MBK7603106.1 gliding motility-associated C-terminal domain-containing protein [Candidatus Brachybacter algidus]